MNLYESVKKTLTESEYDDSVVVMECNRIGYGPDQVMDDSLTVGELIDTLNEYDSNMKIVTSHDSGYTYGPIHYEDFSEEEVDRDEEDEEEIDESCRGKEIKEADEDVVLSVKEKDIKRLEDEIAKAESRAKEAGSDYVKHPTQKTYGWYDYCKTYADGLKKALEILKGTPEKAEEPKLKEAEESNLNVNEIASFIEKAVNDLQTTDYTCSRYPLDDDLAIYVGWSAGYGDEPRDDVIQDKNNPDYGINVGIKVRNDYDWTDFDYLNFPIYNDDSGEIWDAATSISPDDDYKKTAKWLIDEYKDIKKAVEKDEVLLESCKNKKSKKKLKEAEEDEADIKEQINNIMYILLHHNKNYTKEQYNCLLDLEELLEKVLK